MTKDPRLLPRPPLRRGPQLPLQVCHEAHAAWPWAVKSLRYDIHLSAFNNSCDRLYVGG
jgi:hypothetical protein